jgi:hypothetical protein
MITIMVAVPLSGSLEVPYTKHCTHYAHRQ